MATETRLYRIQTDPNAGAAPFATAFFQTATTVDGREFAMPDMKQVSWPLRNEEKTTTIGGVTLTDAQVSAFVVAIAYREKAAADAAANSG